MTTLTGLPGVAAAKIDAVDVHSITGAMRWLRDVETNAIIASGREGSLNVWTDDDGQFRCEFMRWKKTIHSGRYKHLAAVHDWLREWFPRLEQKPPYPRTVEDKTP